MASLGHPGKFQRASNLGFVIAPTSLNGSQPQFARCLAVSWAGALHIHFWGLLASNGILAGATFTFRPSLEFRSYICSVTARHSNSRPQPNFAATSRGRNLYSAGRPSRSALAHILIIYFCYVFYVLTLFKLLFQRFYIYES